MPQIKIFCCLIVFSLFLGIGCASKRNIPVAQPQKTEIIAVLRQANDYFMNKWPDTGEPLYTTRWRPSNIWTRAVYYEGLLALNQVDPQRRYYDYAVDWGEKHQWGMRNGIQTRNADDQACGQTYLDLYQIDQQEERIAAIKENIDFIISSGKIDDWTWVDAIQMAMPVYAKMGVLFGDEKYFDYMHQLYLYSRNVEGGGLYNAADKLWWRDKDFVSPYKEPNGEDCYWSRGNGWVAAALVRVLEVLPIDAQYREVYLQDYQELMAGALAAQRADGFWNVSMHDPSNFGGRETSGTALFVYGMAWGVRNGILDASIYKPALHRGWTAMVQEAVHPSGFLGYLQGTGKEPKDGQPVSFSSVPDFEDYGLGCFLLAGSEVYKLLDIKD
ncbi:MAG: glycoside hydrolase family 88/105 protein [Sphingobacterium sp.]|uniref:glycoside hydrolase family 88/105 protein n=1 Tax=Sphingobacterium sp. JB170 TaxID=1434842 RepID=UPI00097ED635|nr:glycoside hydrolase family 88 protein [Sphingobacterium sp. JB170]SJN34405.1 Rhamnogalacturonides degradation protein RhiN [Sphingobacterium sp. JB170]